MKSLYNLVRTFAVLLVRGKVYGYRRLAPRRSQERRTAIISAAVTGKIDVREFAHQETA